MCTVTFIPTKKGAILTSSRDERSNRLTFPPRLYPVNNRNILFPKDKTAGGTWVAASEDFRFACLLNGAFEKHLPKGNYRKSRGLVLLESFQYDTIESFADSYNFEGIEPFTLLLIDQRGNLCLEELRWDGFTLFRKPMDTTQKHIWSSSTLYAPEIRDERQRIFYQWTKDHSYHEHHDILHFHSTRHGLAVEHDMLMERNDGLQTVSVTQLLIEEDVFSFHYHDLINQSISEHIVNRL